MTERSHYDTLGVPHNASQATIKMAWRKLCSELHPDRLSGDPQGLMAAVNAAYEVLGDPVRRAAYDAGQTEPVAHDPDKEAREMLRQFLTIAADDSDDGHFLDDTRAMVEGVVERCRDKLAEVHAHAAGLQRRRNAISTKPGAINLAAEAIDVLLAKLAEVEKVAREGMATAARAMVLLDAHESSEVKAPPEPVGHRGPYFSNQSFTGTASTVNWGPQ